MSKKAMAAILAIALMIGMLATGVAAAQESPAPDEDSTEAPAGAGGGSVFTVGLIEDMKSVSPFKACCSPEYEMMFLVYDQLLNFDTDTLEAAPGIAESWEHNEDSTEWTFKIADGLKWSDGEPLTSADVKFTFDYILNNRPNGFSTYLPGDPTIEAPDPATVIYQTEKPSLAPGAPAWIPILPEHIWSKYDGDLQGAKETRMIPTVGSGPFVLTDWKEGQFWTFEQNPYWRGQKPNIDTLIFRVYDVAEAQVQALKTGEVDFAEDIPPALFDQLVSEQDPNIETWEASASYFINLAFGLWKPSMLGSNGEKPTNHPALMDTQVRVAISKAIDKDTLVERVKLGYGIAGTSPILPQSRWAWNPEETGDTTQDFDPAEANRILDEAGYEDTDGDGVREMPGGGEPLIFQFLTLTDTNTSTDSGEYIKDWLDEIGIKVELKPVTTGKAYDAWYAHDYDAYIWGWGNDPDPDFTLSLFTTGQCDVWSDGCYSNAEYDAMYEEQRASTDEVERAAIVDQMQEHIYQEVPEVILFYEQDLQAWRKDRWEGMVPQPAPNGSVMFTFGPASNINLKPVAAGEEGAAAGDADSDSNSTMIWIIVGVVVLIGVILVVVMRKRTPDEDRE